MGNFSKQWFLAGFCQRPELVAARQAGLLDEETKCRIRESFRDRLPGMIQEFRNAVLAGDPDAEVQEITSARAVFFRTDKWDMVTGLYEDAHYIIEPVDDEKKEELIALWKNSGPRQPC